MQTFIIFILLLIHCTPAYPAEDVLCANDPRVIDACYGTEGTIIIYANMRPYLNPDGTKELLGISQKSNTEDTDYFWPADIEKMMSYNSTLHGNFRVCPFTKKKPGEMQIVCIQTARNLTKTPVNK